MAGSPAVRRRLLQLLILTCKSGLHEKILLPRALVIALWVILLTTARSTTSGGRIRNSFLGPQLTTLTVSSQASSAIAFSRYISSSGRAVPESLRF
ncbi:hypothetical protein BC834DRAFT_890793 [Gloeopeniophorella convolvens]|nr:hypothetical protein BC834DRAFT_890793 [Gloeopeniophorella convolvens]